MRALLLTVVAALVVSTIPAAAHPVVDVGPFPVRVGCPPDHPVGVRVSIPAQAFDAGVCCKYPLGTVAGELECITY